MVFNKERGCVRGNFGENSCAPENTPLSRRSEKESALWSEALNIPQVVSLESDLEKIYESVRKGQPIAEMPLERVENSIGNGFNRYRIKISERIAFPRDVAYRCGDCHIIVAGRPIIRIPESILPESLGQAISNTLEYSCGMCNQAMLWYQPDTHQFELDLE